jgi:hypothetical protein
MQNLYRRVDKCQTAELRKDGSGNAAIYKDGKLLASGGQYIIGRQWLDVKQKEMGR